VGADSAIDKLLNALSNFTHDVSNATRLIARLGCG
jgi:hypothetical protein